MTLELILLRNGSPRWLQADGAWRLDQRPIGPESGPLRVYPREPRVDLVQEALNSFQDDLDLTRESG